LKRILFPSAADELGAAFGRNQKAPIAQDIHPGRKISWDIRPSRTHVRLYFPSGINMPNDRLRQFSRARNCNIFVKLAPKNTMLQICSADKR